MLPYDEIPAERRTIVDYTGRLGDEGHIGVLAVALAQWWPATTSKADADARRAANTAMDALDAALALLHELRSRLVTEIREPTTPTRRASRRAARPVQGGTTMNDSPHDHDRPGIADMRAALPSPASSSTAPT